MADTKAAISGLNIDEAKLSSLLDLLDRKEALAPESNRRTDERFLFRQTVLVEVRRAEGSWSSFNMPTRNLSRTGICLLFPGYIHTGTKCRVQLMTTHNNWQTVEGAIRWCRYLQGRLHDVGIRFDQNIDITMFCAQAVTRRFLIVDDDPAMVRLISHHLQSLNVNVAVATNGRDGVEQAMGQMFDCVLMDIEMPEMDGFEALTELRTKGYTGMVIATTGRTGPDDEQRIRTAGFSRYFKKPVTKEALKGLLASLADEPIFSSMAQETSMHSLINQFVEELVSKCRSFEQTMANAEMNELERLARNLKSEAGSYGFEPITEASEKLERLIQAKSAADQVADQVRELSNLCRLVRPVGK